MEKIDPGPIEGRVMRNIRLHAKRLARSNTVPGMDVQDYVQDLTADLVHRVGFELWMRIANEIQAILMTRHLRRTDNRSVTVFCSNLRQAPDALPAKGCEVRW